MKPKHNKAKANKSKQKKSKQPKEPRRARTRKQEVRAAQIHRLLKAEKYPNATYLAALFEVTTQTIYRTLQYMMDFHGASIDFDRKRNGYFYITPMESFLDVTLTEGELFAILLGGQALQAYHGQKVAKDLLRAYKKLAELLPEEITVDLKDIEETITFHKQPETIYDPEIFQTLLMATRKSRQLEIFYHTPGKEPRWRVVDPYAFPQVGRDCYLIAFDHDRGKEVTFCPQRTSGARETGKTFERPKDFSVEKFLKGSFGVFSAEGNYDVVIRFKKEVAHRIREKRWPCQERLVDLEDGGVDLHLKVTSLVEVKAWMGEFFGKAYPLQPPEFVEAYVCAAKEMLSNVV